MHAMTSLSMSRAMRGSPPSVPHPPAGGAAAALARRIASVVGTPFRRAARVADRSKPDTYAAHREALWQRGDSMIAAANAEGARLSVVMFDQVHLPELHALFGGAAARSVVSKFNRKVLELAGGQGLPVRCGPTTWTVLLPHASQEQALADLRKVFGDGLAVESDGGELLLVPRIVVRAVGQEALTMRQLHEAMAEEIQCGHLRQSRRERPVRRRATQD